MDSTSASLLLRLRRPDQDAAAVGHILAADLPGYEQKPDTRPTTLRPVAERSMWVQRAADRETKPEDGAEVDRELG